MSVNVLSTGASVICFVQSSKFKTGIVLNVILQGKEKSNVHICTLHNSPS